MACPTGAPPYGYLLFVLAAVYHHTVSLLSPMYLTLRQALTTIKTWC